MNAEPKVTVSTSTSTDSSVASTDWRHRAVCSEEDPDLFFPIGDTGPALLQAQEAKKVCRRCPVIDSCLQWALETNQDHGVWGGTSEADRRSARRRVQRQAATARSAA